MEQFKKRDSFFLPGKKQQTGNKFNNKVTPQDSVEKPDFKGKRQENFDKIRSVKQDNDEKKPFDKKTYRLKKYSKKYKLEQWEEQRKKRLLRNLQKDLKNNEGAGTYKPKTFDQDATDGEDVVGRFVKHPDMIEKENIEKEKEKRKPVLSASAKHEKLKQDKLEKEQKKQKAIEEKRQKMQEYKKKKQEKFKKLSKKTKKGQPVMTGRLELLLEKIQKNK